MQKTAYLFLFLPVLLTRPAAVIQETSRPAAVVSPQILPDHRVVFHLRAPKAGEVTIAGSFWLEEGRTEKLTKDDQGVWSLTTGPLPADYYSYYFTVDGIRMPDPANGQTKPGILTTQSAFSIPGKQAAFLEAGPVPHGEIRQVFYRSAVVGKLRRMHIYFPPGYETGQMRYPVVYLLHGGGDDDWAWITIGRANFILDNLIAQDKAKPMIVVMPSLWALDPPVPADRRAENEALFAKSLIQDIIPFVEAHYRVLTGPANRALGGLGVGREMLPHLYWPNLDKFNYIFHTSGGVNPEWLPELEKKYPGVLDDPANIRRVKFFIGNGTNDHSNPSAAYLSEELKRRGYSVTYFVSNGIHEWPWFRRYFAEFAPAAFR